jgi:hypothetical protein
MEITSRARYWSVHSPGKADAASLLLCIADALKFLGIENILDKEQVLGVEGRPLLVGAGTDGASVNSGEQTGLKGQMQHALPIPRCFAHRIELACIDSFTSPFFLRVQEMLLCLYYI